MRTTRKVAFLDYSRKSITFLLFGAFLIAICTCATGYKDEKLQPLAATASDLARAVMRFAREHPAEAASLDDRELVRRATAYDPEMLAPYDGLVVRGTIDGVILVCDGKGKRGLIEDAECTDRVDKIVWSDENAPCRFTLKCN
jgi:hypothetical protein